MKDPKLARALFDSAEADMTALRHMGSRDAFADFIFGFHAQQAVEKLLKAALAERGIPFPRTHDLKILFQLLAEITDAASPFADLVDLTDFAVQLRYDVAIDAEPLDRRLTVDQIKQLWDAVRAR